METWELVARESIRDLVARYNAKGDAGLFDAMLELFTEDAILDLEDGVHHGRSAIRDLFEEVAARTGQETTSRARFIRHFTSTHQIDLTNRSAARGRAYYVVFTDLGADHWGRYVDDYRQVDGRWLFARRRVTMDASVPGGWSDVGVRGVE